MIIWGIFWGAAVGYYMPWSDGLGLWLGAFGGLFAGWSLRWAVRREVAKTQGKLRAEMLAAIKPAGRIDPVLAEHGAAEAPFETPASTVPPMPVSDLPGAALAEPATPDFSAASNELARPAKPDIEPEISSVPRPPRVPKPYQPNALDLALVAAKNWLLGGNTIVRVGLVILFIGLSFLVRFAAVAGVFPIELRLGVVGAAAIALLAIGFKKRQAKPAFALALQGAGVAVIYLTVFAAFRLYDLVPPLLAFGLMIVVCALSCALALLQNARSLAVAAFAGGFAVPLLLSTGEGSHVGLFSYYLLLNVAILFIAYQRSWRVLNVVGYVATFGVATAWGVLKYAPENYASAQFFLIAFVLIYLLTSVLYARNTPTKLGNAVDSILVFGTPLIGFGLQAGLVRHIEFGTAFSAVGFAAVYLATAMVLARRHLANYRLLVECFLAIGVGFATLAVPLALDARWTSAIWALEGAGAFWVGKRQARWMPRAFGLLMQLVAALVFVDTFFQPGANVSAWPLANPVFIGAMFLALPAFAIAWWLRQPLPHSDSAWARHYASIEARGANAFYLYGFAFWCLAWVLELSRRVPAVLVDEWPRHVFREGTAQMLTLLALVLSALASLLFGQRKQWPVASWPARLTVVAMALIFGLQVLNGHRVLDTPAWLIWPAVLVLHFWMLRRLDVLAADALPKSYRAIHVAGVWLVTLLLADVLWYLIGRGQLWSTSWASVVLLVSATGVLMGLAAWAGRANDAARRAAFGWPLQPHADAYYWTAALPLAALVGLGALAMAVSSPGRTAPLPYIPLLNPTDLAVALALGALLFWRRVLRVARPAPTGAAAVRGKPALVALSALGFIAFNTVWLRIAHHFFGVDWDAGALFDSFVVQTGYAILWTLMALTVMVVAHRRATRAVWLVGAGLLGVVVVKLLLIDLSNIGGAERIVAFIVVGVLMLVVGYFAPLPPKVAAPSTDLDTDTPAADLSLEKQPS